MARITTFINRLWIILALFCLTVTTVPRTSFSMGSAKHKETPADAVILVLEKNYQVDQDGSYTLTVHIKTKINTYQGKKSWADFKASYNSNFESVQVIEAYTITPKGMKVPVTSKEIHDITDPATQSASLFSASRLKVVNFPSVETGCTVEMTLKKSSRLGLWSVEPFSLKDPIKLKRVRVSMPATMPLSIHLKTKDIDQQEERVDNKKIYTWTGVDRGKIIPEPMMPPIYNRSDTLIFSTLRSWKEVSSLFKRLYLSKVKNQNLMTTDFNDLFKKERAKDIFLALKKEFEVYPIGFFRSNLAFSSPIETLTRGYGTQMDMLILFRYLLNKKGIGNQMVAVNSAGIWLEGLKDCYDPALFNTFFLKVGNRFYSFDMKYAGPGITGLDGSIGLDLDRANFIQIKDEVENETNEEFDLTFETPFSFTASYHARYRGLKSVSIKGNFKDLTPSEFDVKQSIYYHSLHPVAKPVAPLKITGIDLASLEANISGKYKVENFRLDNHGNLFFPVRSPGVLRAFFSMLPERKSPIFIKRALDQEVTIRARLAPDIIIKHTPSNTSGSIGPFYWQNRCSLKGRNLLCQKSVKIKRGFIRSGLEYQKVRKTVQDLMAPLNNTVVFQQTNP